MEYVSTAKWRERRWRLFSTFPLQTWWAPPVPDPSYKLCEGILWFGVRVFFPEFLGAEIRVTTKMEAASKLGVAFFVKLRYEIEQSLGFSYLRVGRQEEFFVPKISLIMTFEVVHLNLSIESTF